MEKTKGRELDKIAKAYIIGCIDGEAYDVELKTPLEKLRFLRDTFRSEYGFAIPRMGESKAFMEWIQGLPTCFGIAFTNYDILELARAWGSLDADATEREEQAILDNYWNFITVKTFQMFKILDKPITPAELRARVESTGSFFFTRSSMKFFGDTMSNYGVRSGGTIGGVDCWELYRKKPVKHGLQAPAYFSKKDFSKVFKA